MGTWKNRGEEERFTAQASCRPAQQGTMEQLWDSQPRPFYRKDRESITKTGAYPQGFYRMGSVKDLH